jgi:hypothetical protein
MDTASVICGPELLLLRASREAYDMCIWLSWRSEELIQQSRESRARICWGGRCASVIRRGEGLSDAVLLSHTTSSRQLFFKTTLLQDQSQDWSRSGHAQDIDDSIQRRDPQRLKSRKNAIYTFPTDAIAINTDSTL